MYQNWRGRRVGDHSGKETLSTPKVLQIYKVPPRSAEGGDDVRVELAGRTSSRYSIAKLNQLDIESTDRHLQARSCAVCPPQRYIFAVMGFFAIANAYTMRICLSLAITEMVTHHSPSNSSKKPDPDACPANPEDFQSPSMVRTLEYTRFQSAGTFDWDERTQGLILSSFFWGYVVTHLPGGMLAERFGGKYSLGLGILSTAVLTLLTPLAATYGGANWLIGVRILEGLGEGSTFPAMNALLAQWAPPSERSRIGSLVFAGAQIGTVVSTALSGALLHYTSWGWPSVFYTFGLMGVLWFILWDMTPVPWRAILTSVPLWGLIVAQIGHDWGFFTMVTDLPKYMRDVMKFNIGQNGYLSALPYLIMWFVSLGSGCVADWMIAHNKLSVTSTRKVFTSIASIGPSIGIIAASYAGCDRTAAVVLFTIGMALMGTFYPGMKVNALDLSPNYAGTLMALVNGIGALSGIITPYLVGILTPDSTLVQWRLVFWISVGVFLLTNFVFVFTASGEVQPWNSPSSKQGKEENANTTTQSKNVSTNTGRYSAMRYKWVNYELSRAELAHAMLAISSGFPPLGNDVDIFLDVLMGNPEATGSTAAKAVRQENSREQMLNVPGPYSPRDFKGARDSHPWAFKRARAYRQEQDSDNPSLPNPVNLSCD
uniref:Sialin n=1 Tax=Timema tahoe TaxID=61484 RepID=A0A7R9IEK4_9NEOP|nr:unnamed protein product [Timema tahoe]